METVAVIGSNSFSGSDFVDLLLEETPYQVIGISRSPQKGHLYLPYLQRSDLFRFEFHQLDLNRDMPQVMAALAHRQPAYVVNFASQSEVAPSWEYPEQWFQTNAVAVAALGNFLRKQKWLKRYVHISTPEVYGPASGLIVEESPFSPSTPYAASRAAAELLHSTLAKSFGFPVVTIRSANVYGPHQQLFKIIPRSSIFLKLGRTIPLEGGGIQQRSFIHIRDVSRGELAAMQRGRTGEAYHLATREMTTIRNLVQAICDVAGEEFERATEVVPARIGGDPAYRLDAAKAESELDWRPAIALKLGLEQVHTWIEREWGLIQGEPLQYVHRH